MYANCFDSLDAAGFLQSSWNFGNRHVIQATIDALRANRLPAYEGPSLHQMILQTFAESGRATGDNGLDRIRRGDDCVFHKYRQELL